MVMGGIGDAYGLRVIWAKDSCTRCASANGEYCAMKRNVGVFGMFLSRMVTTGV